MRSAQGPYTSLPICFMASSFWTEQYNRTLAVLDYLVQFDDRRPMTHTHRLEAVRAHLLERAGDTGVARESYLQAARMTASAPEQRYLALCAARLHTRTAVSRPVTGRLSHEPGRSAAR